MKPLLIYVVLLFSSRWCAAQSKIGFVIFPQLSSLSNTAMRSDSVNKNLTTLSGGAGITYTRDFSTKIGIQTGLIYSSQNQKIKSSWHSSNGALNIEHIGKKRFDYLKIPLSFRYTFLLGAKASLVPFAGIQFSYLLKYDGGMVVYGSNYFDLPETPAKNNYYKKLVMDIPLGLNLEYAITKKTHLVFGFKFDYALTNAANKNALYNAVPISSFAGNNTLKQRNITYGLNLGMSFALTKTGKKVAIPHHDNLLADVTKDKKIEPVKTYHHKKDTVALEGKHHHRNNHHHSTSTTVPIVSSNREHVMATLNKTYVALIKGVVYKKGTNELLNDAKILLETEEKKVDSSVTFIGGTYTLHVQERGVQHKMYVYRKGYKPLLIDVPDTLIDKQEVCIIKIQLELDGSGKHLDEVVTITANGHITDTNGNIIPNAQIVVRNNIDKTSKHITSDTFGNYSATLKKYSHYTFSASKDDCSSQRINKSTIEIKKSTILQIDLSLTCP